MRDYVAHVVFCACMTMGVSIGTLGYMYGYAQAEATLPVQVNDLQKQLKQQSEEILALRQQVQSLLPKQPVRQIPMTVQPPNKPALVRDHRAALVRRLTSIEIKPLVQIRRGSPVTVRDDVPPLPKAAPVQVQPVKKPAVSTVSAAVGRPVELPQPWEPPAIAVLPMWAYREPETSTEDLLCTPCTYGSGGTTPRTRGDVSSKSSSRRPSFRKRRLRAPIRGP